MLTIGRTVMLVFALVAMVGGCSFSTARLREPAPVPVPAGNGSTERAIIRAMGEHGWVVEQTAPGSIVAHLEVREHDLWVTITYDQREVRLQYQKSSGLGFEQDDDGPMIHKKYMSWTRKLMSAIQSELYSEQNGAASPTAPPPVATAPVPPAPVMAMPAPTMPPAPTVPPPAPPPAR